MFRGILEQAATVLIPGMREMAHETRDSLLRTILGQAAISEATRVAGHVVVCDLCRSLAEALLLELPIEPTKGPARFIRDFIDQEGARAVEMVVADAQWATMRGKSLKAQKERIAEVARCRTPTFVHLLLEELRSSQNWEGSERLGSLATSAIHGITSCAEDIKNDLHAHVWVEVGNARRRAAEWSRSEDALKRAASYIKNGTQDPALLGRFLSIYGSLEADTGRLAEALLTLERCKGVYHQLRDWNLVARTLIKTANVLAETDPSQALQLLNEAEPLITDEKLRNTALLLRVDCLIWLSRAGEAQRVFIRCSRPSGGRPKIRYQFVGARLLSLLGLHREAERLFSDVVTSDLELALYKDALLDLLYLFQVHVGAGESAKAADVCRRALTEAVLADFSHDQLTKLWQHLLRLVETHAVEIDVLPEIKAYLALHWKSPSSHSPSWLQGSTKSRTRS